MSTKNFVSYGDATTLFGEVATQLATKVANDDARLSDARNAKDVYEWAKAATKPTYTASEVGAIATTAKGAANGVAELGSDGKVPASQLPSYVDDVIEAASYSALPSTGESGKIYVTLDTNKTYRWSGTAYVEISASLALGETDSTAYRGDRGKVAYDHATDASKVSAAVASGFYKVAATAEGHVASLTAVAKSDITALGIPGEIPGEATTSTAGLMSAADKTKLNGVATGAEVNQNAYSAVKYGATTMSATSKTDTFEFLAGSNITLTADGTNKTLTIASTSTDPDSLTTAQIEALQAIIDGTAS